MRRIIHTDEAPEPIGPYSQAILIDNILYTSGQIGIVPSSGELITGDLEAETHQVMKNLKAVLSAAKMDFSKVVKTSIFLKNMDDFNVVNQIYGSYIDSDMAPARETVQVARLPKDVNVEISMVAVI